MVLGRFGNQLDELMIVDFDESSVIRTVCVLQSKGLSKAEEVLIVGTRLVQIGDVVSDMRDTQNARTLRLSRHLNSSKRSGEDEERYYALHEVPSLSVTEG